MKGYLDEVSRQNLTGWACDDEGNPVDLLAQVNDKIMMSFRPSTLRPDLVHLKDRNRGFELDLGQRFKLGDVVSVINDRGEHLVGSPHRVTNLHLTREEKALWLISREMKSLEVGGSYNPLIPRSEGWNSFSFDHASQEELRVKYKGHNVSIDRIQQVDFLWKEGPIELAVPVHHRGTFDAMVASHVIEHIPNPIGFFVSAAVLLKDGGLVSLVIPDKRVMFDFFRPITLTGDFLAADYLRRTRHSRKTAFDHVAYCVTEKNDIAWSARLVNDFRFMGDNSLPRAKKAFEEAAEDESVPYTDYHTTTYTPSSFALILFELGQMGVVPFRIEVAFPTEGCEFFVTLRKGAPPKFPGTSLDEERLRLMKATIRELGQQAQWLLPDESGISLPIFSQNAEK
jgi:hypothetical protein